LRKKGWNLMEKLLELWTRLQDQRGQTSAEYVAVTAVAVAIAIGVIYSVLSGALTEAVGDIGSAITNFIDEELGGAAPEPDA
jgi:Flp pilus assembly pilin Flp